MKSSNIAVILVNWNQYELTRSCIISILNCSFQDFEIFLVDNASEDNSLEKLKQEFSDITFIQNKKNLGFTGANNIAIKEAIRRKFEYIMLLNNDTEVKFNFFEPLLLSLKNDTKLVAVQPLILNFHDKNTVWNFGGKFNNFFGYVTTMNKGINKSKLLENKNTEWISGCCFLFKSEIIDKIGYLDDYFFVYYEDADFSLRIKEAGYEIGLQKNSEIYHHEGASWKLKKLNKEGKLSPYTRYLTIRNHIYFIQKHQIKFNFLGKWIYQFFKIFSFSFYFIVRMRFQKLSMVFKGFKDGLKGY